MHLVNINNGNLFFLAQKLLQNQFSLSYVSYAADIIFDLHIYLYTSQWPKTAHVPFKITQLTENMSKNNCHNSNCSR